MHNVVNIINTALYYIRKSQVRQSSKFSGYEVLVNEKLRIRSWFSLRFYSESKWVMGWLPKGCNTRTIYCCVKLSTSNQTMTSHGKTQLPHCIVSYHSMWKQGEQTYIIGRKITNHCLQAKELKMTGQFQRAFVGAYIFHLEMDTITENQKRSWALHNEMR